MSNDKKRIPIFQKSKTLLSSSFPKQYSLFPFSSECLINDVCTNNSNNSNNSSNNNNNNNNKLKSSGLNKTYNFEIIKKSNNNNNNNNDCNIIHFNYNQNINNNNNNNNNKSLNNSPKLTKTNSLNNINIYENNNNNSGNQQSKSPLLLLKLPPPPQLKIKNKFIEGVKPSGCNNNPIISHHRFRRRYTYNTSVSELIGNSSSSSSNIQQSQHPNHIVRYNSNSSNSYYTSCSVSDSNSNSSNSSNINSPTLLSTKDLALLDSNYENISSNSLYERIIKIKPILVNKKSPTPVFTPNLTSIDCIDFPPPAYLNEPNLSAQDLVNALPDPPNLNSNINPLYININNNSLNNISTSILYNQPPQHSQSQYFNYKHQNTPRPNN